MLNHLHQWLELAFYYDTIFEMRVARPSKSDNGS
jgi:hypothetical protein